MLALYHVKLTNNLTRHALVTVHRQQPADERNAAKLLALSLVTGSWSVSGIQFVAETPDSVQRILI